MNNRRFLIGALCDIGKVKKSNQDNILVKIGIEADNEFGLFVVADGLGGLAQGDKASRTVIEQFNTWWSKELAGSFGDSGKIDLQILDKQLHQLIQQINSSIYQWGNKVNAKIGSTLSMLFIYRNQYIIKHIGDSRIYIIHDSIRQITEDHSWVMQQVREGKMNERQARFHPKRNVLLTCLGASDHIDIQEVSGYMQGNETFLLCSDGFHTHLTEGEILQAVLSDTANEVSDMQAVTDKLFQRIIHRGAKDNASAVIIRSECSEWVKGKSVLLQELVSKIFNR